MDERGSGDLKTLLEENTRLARENHRLLKAMRRSQMVGSFFRVVYWALIIFSIFGVYYFIQPYLNIIGGNVEKVQSGIDTLQSIEEFDLNSLLGR